MSHLCYLYKHKYLSVVTIPTIPFELHQQLKQTFPYAVILREFEGARGEQKISRKTNWRAFWSHQNLKQKFTRVVSEIRKQNTHTIHEGRFSVLFIYLHFLKMVDFFMRRQKNIPTVRPNGSFVKWGRSRSPSLASASALNTVTGSLWFASRHATCKVTYTACH